MRFVCDSGYAREIKTAYKVVVCVLRIVLCPIPIGTHTLRSAIREYAPQYAPQYAILTQTQLTL